MIDGKDIKPGAITNTNVNSSAGIELKKLEKGGPGQIVVTDSAGTQKYVNLSGDVTVDNDGVATVSADVSSSGTGTVGPQGPAGPQGAQGPAGGQGNPGAPGSDAAVTKANIDNALYGADTTTVGFVKRTANDDYGLDTATYLTGNQTITLGGDVSGSGTTSISCTVDDDSHTHGVGTITGVINTSAGASSAGKLIKLDAAGHIDHTMINDADISYTSIANVPSTFAPSTHTHGTNQITGLGAAAEKDTGTTSSTVATGDQGFDVHKYTKSITWGSSQSEIVYSSGTGTGTPANGVATITHSLDTRNVLISIIDVAGTSTASGTYGFVDIDSMVHIKSIDTNRISIEWELDSVPNGDEFILTVIG